jgi:hypothetical protein
MHISPTSGNELNFVWGSYASLIQYFMKPESKTRKYEGWYTDLQVHAKSINALIIITLPVFLLLPWLENFLTVTTLSVWECFIQGSRNTIHIHQAIVLQDALYQHVHMRIIQEQLGPAWNTGWEMMTVAWSHFSTLNILPLMSMHCWNFLLSSWRMQQTSPYAPTCGHCSVSHRWQGNFTGVWYWHQDSFPVTSLAKKSPYWVPWDLTPE